MHKQYLSIAAVTNLSETKSYFMVIRATIFHSYLPVNPMNPYITVHN